MKKELFELGLKMSIQMYYKNYVMTYVIGCETDAYLILKMAYFNGKPLPLKAKDSCKIRFMKRGTAYGFETEVISTQSFPASLIFLKYPANIEQLSIRKDTRVMAKVPAMFEVDGNGTKAKATIVDLSENGCGLKITLKNEVKVIPGGSYHLSFEMMGKKFDLESHIRSLKIHEADQLLGLQFINMKQQDGEALRSTIEQLQEQFYV